MLCRTEGGKCPILPCYHHRYQMCQRGKGFVYKNFVSDFVEKIQRHAWVFYPRCNQPRTIRIPLGAAAFQSFIQVFPLGWPQEIFIGQGLSFTSEM